jgi:hypothetical protein
MLNLRRLAAATIAIGGLYYYYSPTIMSWSTADDSCINFIKKNAADITANPDPIFVAGKWLRGNHVVVQVAWGQKSEAIHEWRICDIRPGWASGWIEVPAIADQAQWQGDSALSYAAFVGWIILPWLIGWKQKWWVMASPAPATAAS